MVRLRVGAVRPRVIEQPMLGRLYGDGFRWMEGDWQTVTHWRPCDEQP